MIDGTETPGSRVPDLDRVRQYSMLDTKATAHESVQPASRTLFEEAPVATSLDPEMCKREDGAIGAERLVIWSLRILALPVLLVGILFWVAVIAPIVLVRSAYRTVMGAWWSIRPHTSRDASIKVQDSYRSRS